MTLASQNLAEDLTQLRRWPTETVPRKMSPANPTAIVLLRQRNANQADNKDDSGRSSKCTAVPQGSGRLGYNQLSEWAMRLSTFVPWDN